MFLYYTIKTEHQNYAPMCVYMNIYSQLSLLRFIFVCLPTIPQSILVALCRDAQSSKNLSHHMHTFSAEVKLGDVLSCFSSHDIVYWCHVFCILCFFWGDINAYNGPQV